MARTRIIAVANQKGGTGKSTIAVNLAVAAGETGHRVLVVDVDPQADATTMLGVEPDAQPRTLYDVFVGDCELPDAVRAHVAPGVDLGVGTDRMADVEVTLAGELMRERFLHGALEGHTGGYDLVLVDCPPNLGIVTLNGLRVSDGYIIPTIPDVLSTYGIPQIQERVAAFADDLGQTIAEIGIVVTKYRAASTVHRNTIVRMQDDDALPVVLDTWVPEANQIAASAEYADYSRLRQKYGYAGQFDIFRELTKEFIAQVEANA